MKKRLPALLLACCLAVSLLAWPAAAAEETGALQTVRALGILVGDSSGNLNLDAPVTRAQFAKMAVAASTYKDTVGTNGTGYSLFRDVKSSYWASEYIKTAVDQKWMVGYTDGSFRPYNTITLEQACATVLRMLGYDSAALAGSYPAAQLSKAAALGLRDEITLARGGVMTRRDCMNLFYNLLTAQNSAGQVYAVTLGYTVTNGQVDYAAVVSDSLSGPYVCGSSKPTLSFTPAAVYRDGTVSSLAAMGEYDVYYYNASLRTVWVYTDRASGTISALSPSAAAPTSVTVAGTTYALGTADAVYKLSAMGGTAVGDTVMLLLGMDGSVADVVTGEGVSAVYYGVVQSYTAASTSTGDAAVETRVSVACTDGAVHTFSVSGSRSFDTGALVSASITASGTTVSQLSSSSLSGTVNSAGTALGSVDFAAGARILDTTSDGAYVKVTAARLAGATLNSGSIRCYVRNASGQITDLILNDATGDTWTYGYMLSAGTTKTGDGLSYTGSYTYLVNGTEKTITTTNASYAVSSGGIALRTNADGSIKTLRSVSSVTISSLGSITATANSRQYRLDDRVQVYLSSSGGGYYLTTLAAVNTADYYLTGWYDNFGGAAGGRIRVIVATAK